MQALISGSVGQAILVEGSVFRSLQVNCSATPKPASSRDVRNFLARATDAYAIEDTQVEHVLEALEAAWEGTAIFNLVQIQTSPFEDDDNRSLAAEELDDSLIDNAAVAFAERSLFSAPWPTEITRSANCSSRVAAFLDRLGNVQTAIKSVDRAFGLVDLQLTRPDKEDFRHLFFATSIREGIHRVLVLYKYGEASRGDVYSAFDKSPSLKSIKNSRNILNCWLKGLGNPERSVRPIGIESTKQRYTKEIERPLRTQPLSKRRGLVRQKELDQVIKQFPENVVAKKDRAETLRLNKMPEAELGDSKYKGIIRIYYQGSNTQGWMVRLTRQGKRQQAFFNDGQYGGKAASRRAALAYYSKFVRESPKTQTARGRKPHRNTTGKVGVHLVINVDSRWKNAESYSYCASWIDTKGKRRTISFAWNLYGKKHAWNLACLASERQISDRQRLIELYGPKKIKDR